MSDIKIHIEGLDSFFDRAKGIARRIDAGERDLHEVHFSYATFDVLLKVLNGKRWALLQRLKQHGPWSIRALAASLGRDYKAVHTDVSVLIENGLIERDAAGRISVPWTTISAEMTLTAA